MLQKFKIRFPLTSTNYWSSRYQYNVNETEIIEKLSPKIQSQKYLDRNDFITLCKWKSPRIIHHIEKNNEDLIQEITSIALTTKFEEVAIGILQILKGVNFPVASVILHFGATNKYPIIDYRALWSLSVDVPSFYTYDFWKSYIDYCRKLSQKTKLDMRTIDKALWQYSKEKQK